MLNRLRREDHGFSLIELLVVLLLMGIVGSIFLRALVGSIAATNRAQERVFALNDLTKGLERIGRELRVADPLDLSQIATRAEAETELGATVRRNDRVFEYQYYLTTSADGTPELWEDVTVFDLAGTAIPAENRSGQFIVGTANVAAGIPLVTYIDDDGDDMDCNDLTDAPADVTTCRARLASAAQVRLTLVRELPDQDPITVQTVVAIRYARFN